MRCPKCGYISFEYNQLCPKCHKDVTPEVAKMNLPTFKPNPPAMLGALTGEASETNMNFLKGTSAGVGNIEESLDLSFDDSGGVSSQNVEFDDGQGLDIDIQTSGENTGEQESGQEQEGVPLDLDGFSTEETGEKSLATEEEGKDDFLLDLDDLKMGDSGQRAAAEDSAPPDEEGLALDLGDIALDDSAGPAVAEDTTSSDEEEPSLELSELTLDDSGGLEANVKSLISGGEDEPLEIDDLSLDGLTLPDDD